MQSFLYTDPSKQQWRQFWPTSLLALIAISQMLLTFIIIGFETWSMILSIRNAFLFIGYLTSFFFTITWISTFTVVCCNRESRGCATHALVENILSIIASSVLLYYDAAFLREPWICYLPEELCDDYYTITYWSTLLNSYEIYDQTTKLIAIKVQLACAALMLATSVGFIIIYAYTSLKILSSLSMIDPQRPIELMHTQPPPPVLVWQTQPPVWPPPSNF